MAADLRLAREPCGQVELSSGPALSLAACVEAMVADLAVLRQAAGLRLLPQDRAAARRPHRHRHIALDVSAPVLEEAGHAICRDYPGLHVAAMLADF
jgi:hypothetical protein